MMKHLDDYQKEKLTIDLVKANGFALLLIIPTVLIFGIPYYLVWQESFTMNALKSFMDGFSPGSAIIGSLMIFMLLISGIVIHELLHGITWARFAEKGFKSIKFGVLWHMLTPYCHCREPLKVKQYISGAIMPAIILGFIPALAAIVIGNLGLLIFGMFFIMAAGGDFMIINLLKKENMDSWVEDHPSEAGCFIYRKK